MESLQSEKVINIPVIFSVNESDYFDFLEKIQGFEFLHKWSIAKLARLHDNRVYPLSVSQIIAKQRRIQDILKYLQQMNDIEISIGKLFKGVHLKTHYRKVSYKTFQRYITEMALNNIIVTRRFIQGEGNNIFVKLK